MDKRSLSVLLVDDDLDDQFFFREALKHVDQSVQLSVAMHGLEAMQKLGSLSPTIIFLDINMPAQNGKECLRAIRAQKDFDHITIVMFTTSSNEEDIEECFRNGANLYVTKPLSTIEQANILKKVFSLYLNNKLAKPKKDNFVFSVYS